MNTEGPPNGEIALSERYYRGTVLRVLQGSRTGSQGTCKGRKIPFAASNLQLIGPQRGFAALYVGLPVGFDLGRTSRGLCVTTIRVYEAA